jgi:hypothetical protein
MVLVWKGWGILSGIIAVAAYVVGLVVSDLQGGWSFFATMAAAAVINGFLGWWLNRSRREANAGLLKSSNQPRTNKWDWYVRYDRRYSFCMIPMEWWSVVMLIIGTWGIFLPPVAQPA